MGSVRETTEEQLKDSAQNTGTVLWVYTGFLQIRGGYDDEAECLNMVSNTELVAGFGVSASILLQWSMGRWLWLCQHRHRASDL